MALQSDKPADQMAIIAERDILIHDNGYMNGQSQIKVHTGERTQVHNAQSFHVVTHPSTNRARRYLTSLTESPSKHWSPPRTSNVAMKNTSKRNLVYISLQLFKTPLKSGHH